MKKQLQARSAAAEARRLRNEVADLRTSVATLHLTLTTVRADLKALRDDLANRPADGAAAGGTVGEPATGGAPSGHPAPGRQAYLSWRAGPLVTLGKLLGRRIPPLPDEQPVQTRARAMRELCLAVLDPAADQPARHQRVSDTVTDLLGGDTGWRNDAELIRALIEVRDTAATLDPAPWDWAAERGDRIDTRRHERLPGSKGEQVAFVVAPGCPGVPQLVVAL